MHSSASFDPGSSELMAAHVYELNAYPSLFPNTLNSRAKSTRTTTRIRSIWLCSTPRLSDSGVPPDYSGHGWGRYANPGADDAMSVRASSSSAT